MKTTLLSIAIACLMLASATLSEAQTTFKTYKKQVSATSPRWRSRRADTCH